MKYSVEFVELENGRKPFEEFVITNYEQLFHEQMKNPEFAKAFHEARVERSLNDMLENLREKIVKNESKEVLLQTIDALQEQLAVKL